MTRDNTLGTNLEKLQALHVGQDAAAKAAMVYIDIFNAGLSWPNKPAGVLALLGPTGTGKTYLVESLAQLIHGDSRAILRIDCGEFQSDHEVARLIGAPPGYLGHRETTPLISQHKLNGATSTNSPLSLVLFDEIEKASPAFQRILLGLLDTGILSLGDNTKVDFSRSLIFMTSNLGSRAIRELTTRYGWTQEELGKAAAMAFSAHFSPEFVNRVDELVVFQPLTPEMIGQILQLELDKLQKHFNTRLGVKNTFILDVTTKAKEALASRGYSVEFGARYLRRVLQQQLLWPIATRLLKDVKRRTAIQIDFRDEHFVYIDVVAEPPVVQTIGATGRLQESSYLDTNECTCHLGHPPCSWCVRGGGLDPEEAEE